MNMKEKIKIVGDDVRLPYRIKLYELSSFISALQGVLEDAVRKDLKRITAEEMIKKYRLNPYLVWQRYKEQETPEVFRIKAKEDG